jgi:hypothetical protein
MVQLKTTPQALQKVLNATRCRLKGRAQGSFNVSGVFRLTLGVRDFDVWLKFGPSNRIARRLCDLICILVSLYRVGQQPVGFLAPITGRVAGRTTRLRGGAFNPYRGAGRTCGLDSIRHV